MALDELSRFTVIPLSPRKFSITGALSFSDQSGSLSLSLSELEGRGKALFLRGYTKMSLSPLLLKC